MGRTHSPSWGVNRVAFTLPDVGLREVRGLVYMDDGYLVLNLSDALLGLVDADKKTVKIEPAALSALRIRRGLFRDRLVIHPRRPDLLDVVPGEHRSAVELRVSRRYRRELELLLDEFEAVAA